MNEHIGKYQAYCSAKFEKKRLYRKDGGDAIHTALCLQLNIYQASIQSLRVCRG